MIRTPASSMKTSRVLFAEPEESELRSRRSEYSLTRTPRDNAYCKSFVERNPNGLTDEEMNKTYACLSTEIFNEAYEQLKMSGNIKTSIKNKVMEALNKLHDIVQDEEMLRRDIIYYYKHLAPPPLPPPTSTPAPHSCSRIEEIKDLLSENTRQIREIKEKLAEKSQPAAVAETYASVTAARPALFAGAAGRRETLHSIVVTSKNELDTGENVLEKVRKVVDAKEGWVEVRKVRKAKDAKVVIGLATKGDRNKLKEKLLSVNSFSVEEVKNRDPLLICIGVDNSNKDDDIIKAYRNQRRE